MKVGEYIKLLRQSKGISQEELGKIVGVQRAAVQKWESGAVQNLKRIAIKKLADYFSVNPANFIFDNVPIEEPINLLNPREEAHIIKYRKLDDHSKDVVDTIIEKELERSENNILHRVPTFEEMYDEFENKILSTDNLGDDGYIHEAAFGGGVWKEKNEVDE